MVAHPIALGIAVFFGLLVLSPEKENVLNQILTIMVILIAAIYAAVAGWP